MLKNSLAASYRRRDTYRAFLGPIAALSFALANAGCGDEDAAEPQVVLEVQAPVSERGVTVASLDYEIACDGDWRTVDGEGAFVPTLIRDGTMQLVGPVASPDELNLWRAAEEPLEGLCLVNLIGRDDREQAVCVATDTFEATAGEAALVDTVIACSRIAGFAGAASLDLLLPAPDPGTDLQTVEYTIDCGGEGTSFFEGTDASVVLNGALEVVEVAMSVDKAVRHTFVDLPVGPCSLQLRARDQDSEVICTGTEGFVIGPDQTTNLPIVLLCGI
ncbi:MAG: hypothetical protein ACN4G0_01035 [Polyangiales bacterium]